MWECFEGFTDRQSPYVCSHMALFAKACEEEITRTLGEGTLLVRGGESCRRVQVSCPLALTLTLAPTPPSPPNPTLSLLARTLSLAPTLTRTDYY